eukprot:TRINITY_DN9229_c0_g1_i2.p1 TRINITY_DN9229_c0_g1~~TRINITY_DN9229_c0_g1_i2.p1  ORF type:complete len:345 (+),score=86.11 TRINITY_DN9229_c0_g1_i2:14-1048(+)
MASSGLAQTSSFPSTSGTQMEGGSSNNKEIIVRVKRKQNVPPIDALWLEFSGRPAKAKRPDLNSALSQLSLSGTSSDRGTNKLLFQHVQTVSFLDDRNGIVESIVKGVNENGEFEQKKEEHREDIKNSKNKLDRLLTSARQKHKDTSRNARFDLVWKSRKGANTSAHDDAFNATCQLYDVVRVDLEEDNSADASRKEDIKSDDSSKEEELMRNYLPLMQEYLPTVAAEYESELSSKMTGKNAYVYDLYTLGKDDNVRACDGSQYPLVHVDDEYFCWDDTADSDADTEDSNAEDNPLNDYPDESDDVDHDEDDSFEESFNAQDEDYDIYDKEDGVFDDESRWAFR